MEQTVQKLGFQAYEKTPEERVQQLNAKQAWKAHMKKKFGKDWKVIYKENTSTLRVRQ